MSKLDCFVIMPIKKEGTPEHAHFRALYENVVKPILEASGYEVRRADEVQETGAITKDIILRLADADLVVADLTDLNPNVFYELGVRHSLRGVGTIMLLDTLRTDRIPFDLGIYRVVNFEGRMEGIGRLRSELSAFVQSHKANRGTSVSVRDNPVHDVLQGLPINAVDSVNGTAEGRLRRELDELQRRIKTYEIKYGLQGIHEASRMSPAEIVKAAILEVGTGHSPLEIIRSAETAAQRRDIKSFLEVVQRVFDLKIIKLTPELYETLITLSARLGLDEITGAIYENVLTIYPTNQRLRSSQLLHFAHSPLPMYRERARQELLRDLEIEVGDHGEVSVSPDLDGEAMMKVGIMLDAYQADGLDEQALRITTSLLEKHGNNTRILRNHARALNRSGRSSEAITWYQRSIWCPDVDDTSVVWYGNHLHNLEHHVDALEVYLLACTMDPDDASIYAHVADEMVIIIRESERPVRPYRQLPKELDANRIKIVREAITASTLCPDFSDEDMQRCMRAARRTDEIDFEEILQLRTSPDNTDDPSKVLTAKSARLSFARRLYALLKSNVTEQTPQIVD